MNSCIQSLSSKSKNKQKILITAPLISINAIVWLQDAKKKHVESVGILAPYTKDWISHSQQQQNILQK